MLKRERDTLKRGAMLVDPNDPGIQLRVLFYLEGAIQDAVPSRTADHSVISREVHFVEIDSADVIHEAGTAPYLDYRPASAEESAKIAPLLEQDWLKGEQLEKRAVNHAIEHLIPRHLERVRGPRDERLEQDRAGGSGTPHSGDQLLGRAGGTLAPARRSGQGAARSQ